MNIAQIIGHTKFDETMPISSANERIHAHEGVSYQPRSLEQSINKQQMEQIVQRMNNNHLVFQNDMGRQFMSLEHKLDAKLLAHGEAIAEIKMGGVVGMRISKLEDDFAELKQEFQELRQLLQANLQSMSKAAYIQEPSSLHPQNCTVFFQQYQFKEEGKEPEEASTRQDKIMADNKVPLDLPTNQIAPHKPAFQDKIMAENKEPRHAPTHQIGPRKPAFDKDYLITTEDTEAFYFLTYSYSKAEVVQIDDYVLTIEHLQKNVTDGFIYDQVINAYAHISSVETDSTSFITTLQARKLLGETGGIDNAKQTTTWANLIANKCIGKNLIFVPMNVNDNHWVLLVLNFLKGEIQILNSLASNPHTRDVVKEHTLWETEMYSNIPQQTDGHSCGAFVLKYMMAWDGDKMTEHFTQTHIHIFKRKISSALLRSDCNKLRLGSYKDLITKEAYDAKCAEVQQEDMSKAADDDVKEINNPIHASNSHSSDKRGRGRPKKNEAADDDVKEISNPIDASNSNTSNKRKRGRPKKNDKTPMSVKDQLTTASIANRVERPNRRVSNPGPLQLSPYKKF
ncbi:uncharacterized protein LOC8062482 isoform X2 [Sorghum bicolor]|uniref:uncharacterized protein LOC8062482 isoform X2 n=1 Tax=Sorghum bicolor TaxID=4558 RepID=UPI000B42413E|nr:uncharacterized protein LOC8062482 isoform X2 [Sorghum bicolor]|eukprot:XP_021321095.1 uncharacterized protein LOC8062482 isoform X2 [Sorghum bicolor]